MSTVPGWTDPDAVRRSMREKTEQLTAITTGKQISVIQVDIAADVQSADVVDLLAPRRRVQHRPARRSCSCR
jgi:hypothetical protein